MRSEGLRVECRDPAAGDRVSLPNASPLNVGFVLSGMLQWFNQGSLKVARHGTILCWGHRTRLEAEAKRLTRLLLVEVEHTRLAALRDDQGLRGTTPLLFDPPHDLDSKILMELNNSDPISRIRLEGLCLELVAWAVRKKEGARVSVPLWLVKARRKLDEEFRHEWSARDLADFAGVHPASLARAFKLHFRCSVGEYVRARRIRWATDRVIGTQEPICQIAIGAGFYDQSHLGRVFKKLLGMTPGELRRSKSALKAGEGSSAS